MSITLVPFDFTAMPNKQQNDTFVVWCGLVMKAIKDLGHKAVLAFPPAVDAGMAADVYVVQKADVWIDELKVNVLLAFNTMLETDVPFAGRPEEKRNFPNVVAADLIASAQEKDKNPPPADTYGILPRPEKADIEV